MKDKGASWKQKVDPAFSTFIIMLDRLLDSVDMLDEAASSGVSIAIIKEVLGHTDIRTTQKYSHVDVLAQSQVFEVQERLLRKKIK